MRIDPALEMFGVVANYGPAELGSMSEFAAAVLDAEAGGDIESERTLRAEAALYHTLLAVFDAEEET